MLTTARQRKIIFIVCTLLSSMLVYEGEATEISTAIEERQHLNHEMHVCQRFNYHIHNSQISITLGTPYHLY